MQEVAQIRWKDTMLDLGAIPLNEPIPFAFPYENTGEQPLLISKAEPTCGCTMIKDAVGKPCLSHQKDSLKGILNLPGDKEGTFVKSIYVMLNTNTGFQVLRLKGTAYANRTEK